eukprot:m.183776 g.183776  ORF g.183776 m.183776 type:complete len:595 (+) comp15549_c0_seq4:133-1917(+)
MKQAPILIAILAVASPCTCIDNGLGVRPPRGWRSWNSYPCTDSSTTMFRGGNILTDAVMKEAMHGVLDTSRKINGTFASLAGLGYNYVSMDDGYQQCNCSTHQDIDPTLPNCSIGDCRNGKCSWHKQGVPQVNLHRFPDMKGLVDYGHSLGLKVGTYLNNCICMEKDTPTYEQDVEWLTQMGFDGVKIDNCGSAHNVTYYSELLNKTGRPVRIEDCHTYPAHSEIGPNGIFECPMNFFRSGGDISASFGSIMGEAFATVNWNDLPVPMSRPGCWAYPDMMQVGNFNGPEPTRTFEEMSHFGLWSIVSSPLVLGFNLSDSAIVDRVWPIITNTHALEINHDYVGHPGTLVKSYLAKGMSPQMVTQVNCESAPAAAQGWRFDDINKRVIAPGGSSNNTLCLSSQSNQLGCPPPTMGGGITDCGLLLANCSNVKGSWTYNKSSQALVWLQNNQSQLECLTVTTGSNATSGRQSSQVTLQQSAQCRQGQGLSAGQRFVLSSDKNTLETVNGTICLSTSPIYGVQLWSKPLSNNRVAILVLNPLSINQNVTVPFADVPNISCSDSCPLLDVWRHTSSVIAGNYINVSLASHQSHYFILG